MKTPFFLYMTVIRGGIREFILLVENVSNRSGKFNIFGLQESFPTLPIRRVGAEKDSWSA